MAIYADAAQGFALHLKIENVQLKTVKKSR